MKSSVSPITITVNDRTHREREHFFGAAKLVAAVTMLSRVLGLVRDMLMVPLGNPILADRFWTAFSVPNLFRRLFGEGALSGAFVPVFTDVAEAEGWDRARIVLANVAGLLAVVLVGLVVAVELGLWAAWAIWGGDAHRLILLQLTGVMLPFMFTVCLLALGSAALNCRGHFAYPAFAPIILNVVLIAAAWAAPKIANSETDQFFILGTSLLAAGLLQLVGVVWLLKRTGLAIIPTLRPVLPEIRRIAGLMGPMLIPLSVLQLSAFADRVLALVFTATPQSPALPLSDGVVRCLYAANRLYQLPMGVLAISLATAVFPLFSRYAARRDVAGLRQATNRALRLGMFLGIPAGVGLILLSRPVVTLIFQRGAFTSFDTDRAVFILRMYCIGMWAYFWNHVLLRAFFSQKDTRTPLLSACLLTVLNLALVIGGIFTPLKAGAIGLATAVTQSLNAIWLTGVLHRRWGRIGLGSILASLLRTLLATACMGGTVVLVLRYMGSAVEWAGESGGRILVVATAVIAGTGVFVLVGKVLRCPELAELSGPLRRRPPEEGNPPDLTI